MIQENQIHHFVDHKKCKGLHINMVLTNLTLQKVEPTEMRVNIMTSWVASISALIGALLHPALCSD
jgi:hypothetical protein